MIEEKLYTTVLLLAAGINVIMACALFNGNFMFRDGAVIDAGTNVTEDINL